MANPVIIVRRLQTVVTREGEATVVVRRPVTQIVKVVARGAQGIPGEPITDYATAAQGALADSAVQPGDLANVATSGAYADLTGKPTLGSAASTDASAYATAAQGARADTALQPGTTTASIAASADKRYVTDAQLTVLGNTSGANSGDQTITLSGDVSGSGTGAITATLATVNADVGTFGSATQASVVTVNAKGLVTAASQSTVTPAVGSITGLGTGVATALGVNVGANGAFVVRGGDAGTPSALVATNASGTAANLAAGQAVVTQSFALGTFYMPFISGFASGNYGLSVNNYYTLNPVTGVFGCGGIQLFSTTQAIRFQGNAYIDANSVGTGRYTPFSSASSNSILRTASGGLRIESTSATELGNVTNAGIWTKPLQPTFAAYLNASIANATGDGTAYTVIFDTEINDVGSNYNNATGVFVAPVTGKYLFTVSPCLLGNIGAAHTRYDVLLVTSNRTYRLLASNPNACKTSDGYYKPGGFSQIADMDAGDTAYVQVIVIYGTKTVTVYGDGSSNWGLFSGYLLG